MAAKNQKYLEMMRDIYDISAGLGLKTFIWGGFAVDILHGDFTREHGDLDCFTENLVENIDELIRRYEALGYSAKYIEEFWMLDIEMDGVHATFNAAKNIGRILHWYLIGAGGTVFCPYEWLDEKPRLFHGVPVYTFGANLAYLIKSNVKLITPEWQPRDKDIADIKILKQILSAQKVDIDEIKKKIWTHHPYWYAKGYEEYYFPMTVDTTPRGGIS